MKPIDIKEVTAGQWIKLTEHGVGWRVDDVTERLVILEAAGRGLWKYLLRKEPRQVYLIQEPA